MSYCACCLYIIKNLYKRNETQRAHAWVWCIRLSFWTVSCETRDRRARVAARVRASRAYLKAA